MRVLGVLVVLLISLALTQAKPKWKQSLKKKHQLTEEEHQKYCSEISCPENSACKVKKGGKRVKAICVKCKPCKEDEALPVCGTDGIDYPSRCELHYQACTKNKLGLLKVKCHGTCAICTEGERMVHHNRPVIKPESSDQEEEEEEEVEKEQVDKLKIKKWKQWKNYKKTFHKYKLQVVQQHGMDVDDSNCTHFENATIGARLLDWFHVLRSEYLKDKSRKAGHPVAQPVFPQMDLRDAHIPYPCGHSHECREPINFMFHYLDKDDDHVLGAEELTEMKEIPHEHCITQFLHNCDANEDGQFSLLEFCECFPIEPPCLSKLKSVPTILQRGNPVPLAGHFLPNCDVDGFFMPMQCHTKVNVEFCWCVDRNGGKVEGTYQQGKHQCPDNTVNEREIVEEL